MLCHADKLLAPPAADSDGESDGSDRVPVPNFQNSFSQALGKALMQLDSGPVSSQQPVVEPGQEPLIPHIYLAEAWYFWLDSLFVQRRSHTHSCLGPFLFQMKKEEKRRRKSRSFCSAHPWFTQSRQHWSSFNHIVSPPLLVFSVSRRSFWNYKLWKRIWVHAASNIVPLASSPVRAVCLSIGLTCISVVQQGQSFAPSCSCHNESLMSQFKLTF